MKKAFLPNLGKKNENVETLSKISSMINHMKLIDDSLKNLFLSEDDLNSHDAFLLFRGKVAKRIVHYSNLAAECKDKILCAEVSDEDAEDIKQQFEYHQGNVERYKNKLSIWWNKKGKDYHRLCMNEFLTKRKSDDHGTFSESEEKKQTDANLKDTKQMMIDEINRMKSVRSELLESSHKLRKQDQIFNSNHKKGGKKKKKKKKNCIQRFPFVIKLRRGVTHMHVVFKQRYTCGRFFFFFFPISPGSVRVENKIQHAAVIFFKKKVTTFFFFNAKWINSMLGKYTSTYQFVSRVCTFFFFFFSCPVDSFFTLSLHPTYPLC